MESSRTRPAEESGRGSGRAGTRAGPPEGEYDLLTAALIGAVVGASATLILRRPAKHRPTARTLLSDAAYVARQGVGRRGRRGARRAARRGAEWAGEHLRPDELREQVGGYLAAARNAINDAVEEELRDLRKSIRRQRRKLGL
jgi:hypothetical protein